MSLRKSVSPSGDHDRFLTIDSSFEGEEWAGIRHRMFASLQGWADGKHERWVADHRQRLLSDLQGSVLEIGPGTGVNFKYLPKTISWHGLEPNTYLHPILEASARSSGIRGSLTKGLATELPYPADTFDAVVGTLVMCSVSHTDVALSEIVRVLKPGGRFLFLEHVAAKSGSMRRRIQGLITPCWSAVGGGCHPNKDTLSLIRNSRFARVVVEEFDVPVPIVWLHIAGYAIK